MTDLPVQWADHSLLLVRFWPLGTFAHPEIEAFCCCFFLELNSRPNQNRAGDASGPQQIKHNFVFFKEQSIIYFHTPRPYEVKHNYTTCIIFPAANDVSSLPFLFLLERRLTGHHLLVTRAHSLASLILT